jgi:hypothetical protein
VQRSPRRRHQPSPTCGCAWGLPIADRGQRHARDSPRVAAKIRGVQTERVSRSTMPPCRPRASPRQAVPVPNLPNLRCLPRFPRLPSLPDLPAHPRRTHCPLPASADRWGHAFSPAHSLRQAPPSGSVQRPPPRSLACHPLPSSKCLRRPLLLSATPSESSPPAARRPTTACRADTSCEGSMPSSPRGLGPSRRMGDGPRPPWATLAQVRRLPRLSPAPVRPLRPLLRSKTSSSPAPRRHPRRR